jgi:hypothetical protein
MTRIAGMPTFVLNFDIARNFSTIGRTLPGFAIHDVSDQVHNGLQIVGSDK